MKTYKSTQKTKKMSNKDHTHFSMLSIWKYFFLVKLAKTEQGLGLGCSMPLSTIFKPYIGRQFYWWRITAVLGEKHRPAVSHWQTYHIMLYRLSVIPTTIRLRPWRPLKWLMACLIIILIKKWHESLFKDGLWNKNLIDIIWKSQHLQIDKNIAL